MVLASCKCPMNFHPVIPPTSLAQSRGAGGTAPSQDSPDLGGRMDICQGA